MKTELDLSSQTLTADLADDVSRRLDRLEQQLAAIELEQPNANHLNLLVFEGTRDRLLAAFVIATSAAACGMKVTMFFTFWAIAALRKDGSLKQRKTWVERAFGYLLPSCPAKTRLSQLNMGGVGGYLLKREMKKKNIADLDQLIETAAGLGVEICICEMSMRLMGIEREELISYPNLEFGGAARFVDQSASANTTLFI
jgi:peroxiredoxin family protein